MSRYRIGVVSDTHGRLRPEVFELLAGVDLILHGGDVGGDHLLTELEAIAPVKAVTGNVDGHPTPDRPLEQRLETPAARIAMAHGHLPEAPSTDLTRMAAHFADFHPDVIVYGHSHIPKLERIGNTWLFNPGAAGPARFGRGPTLGLIQCEIEPQTSGGGGKTALRFLHKTLTP